MRAVRMKRAAITLAAALFLLCGSLTAQTGANACDLDLNGVVNVADAQMAVAMATGARPCTANIVGPLVCNETVVARVRAAALPGGTCVTSHWVTLTWTASTSAGVTGYNIYRGTVSGGPYTRINSTPVAGTSYVDSTVAAGQTYYYVARSVTSTGVESVNSNQAQAVVPSP